MASAKKTAVALATILTCLSAGVATSAVTEDPTPQNDTKVGSAAPATAAKRAPNASMPIQNPVQKAAAEKAAQAALDKKEAEAVAPRGEMLEALECVHNQDPQTGPELEKPDVSTTGPLSALGTASELAAQIEDSHQQDESLAESATLLLAQTGSETLDAPEESKQKPSVDQIIGQLSDHLGSKEKAEVVVSHVLDELKSTYDDQQIIGELQKQVDAIIERDAYKTRIDAVVKKLTASVGSEEKAKAAVDKVFKDLGNQYSVGDIVTALEADAAKSTEVLESESVSYLNQVQSMIEAEEAGNTTGKTKNFARQAKVVAPPKTAKTTPKATESKAPATKKVADSDTVKDASASSSEPALTQEDIIAQQEGLDFKELGAPDDELAKMKQRLTPVKEEDKTVAGTDALLKANFVKIAKRSKVWLVAMNESASQSGKERGVDRAHDYANYLIQQDYLRSIKQKYRAPHIMGDQEVDEFLDMLSEAIYESVGKKRTAVWELDQIFPLYPPSRMHFNYAEMVHNDHFDSLLDELANQKALSLAVRLVSDDIVKKLSSANGQNYVDAGITVTDFVRKMFLENGKSIETTRLSTQILDSFERTINERPETVSEALLNKCHDTTDRLMSMLDEQNAEIKAEFSLYNTFAFLNDDLTASIELISEHVALEESKVAARFTRTLVNSDIHDMKRPTDTPSLVDRAESSKTQELWASLTEGIL